MEEKKYLSENTDNIYNEYNKMNTNQKLIFNKEIITFQNLFSKKEIRKRTLSQYKSLLTSITNNNFNSSLSRIKNIDYFIQILSNSKYYYDVNSINNHLFSIKMVGFRRIKGDGNCFYRSIIYSIIEDLVLNSKNKEFLYFIYDIYNKIKSDFFDLFIKSNELSYNKNHKENLIELIYLIYEILSGIITVDESLSLINSKDNNENDSNTKYKTLLCLDLLYLAFNSLPYFDLFLIGFTKIKIMTYMKRNEKCLFSSNFEVLIGNLLPSQYENNNGDHLFDEFYNDFLIKLNKEAEKVIIYLIPYVFNVNLNVFIVEPSKVSVELFESHLKIITSLDNIPDLMLLYYSFHYEVVYINGINSHFLLDDYINNKTQMSKSTKDTMIDSEVIDTITEYLFNKNIFDYNKILTRINKSKYTNEDFNNIFTLADYSNTSTSFPLLIEDSNENDEIIQIKNIEKSENFMKNELFLKYLDLIHFSKSNLILNSDQLTLNTIKDKFIYGKS